MAYNGIRDFIKVLEEKDELIRIKTEVEPVLEITEITDRVVKNGTVQYWYLKKLKGRNIQF